MERLRKTSVILPSRRERLDFSRGGIDTFHIRDDRSPHMIVSCPLIRDVSDVLAWRSLSGHRLPERRCRINRITSRSRAENSTGRPPEQYITSDVLDE